MNNLVIMHNNEPCTTSMVIAENCEYNHATVIKLVRNHQGDLEEFGRVGFEIQPFETNGGIQQREVALLNEPQATLLITYMNNTPVVRQFKKALVKAFFELRDTVRAKINKRVDVNMNHTRGITNPHGLDIQYRLDLTKIAQNPTRAGLAVIERLTSVCMEDVLEDQCEISSEGKQILEHYLACGALDGTDEKPVSFKHFFEQFVRYYEQTNPGRFRYMLSKKAVGRILREKGFDVRNKGGGTIINGSF